MWSRFADWLYVPTVTQKRFLVSRGLIQGPVSSATSSGKSRSSFLQLSDEDYNRATPSSSSGTEQGLAHRARLHLRLLAQGLTKTATASAGYFPVGQACPAFQPVGSSRPRGRQRPPRSPGCDAPDLASCRAPRVHAAPRARSELAAPAPKRPPYPR